MADSELARLPVTTGITPRRWVTFLNQLKHGQTIRAACAKAGFSRSTLYTTLNADPNSGLLEQIEHAKNEGERRLVEAVTQASHTGDTITTPGGSIVVKPGDWRAAAWLLEHHPHTRERYASIQKQQIGGDPDNPAPVKTVGVQVVGDFTSVERRAAIISLMQQVGALPFPDPDNPPINVTPEETDGRTD